MIDLATLAIKIDSSDVKGGVAELDKLTAAGTRSATATNKAGLEWVRASSAAGRLRMEEAAASLAADRMAKSTETAAQAASRMAKEAQAMARNTTAMGAQGKLASHHMSNLAFQIQDVIIGLQGGQKPMTVFLQQGSQIGQIAMQAGVGLGGMASSVGLMALNFAKAHPLLLAAAAAAGLVSAAIALVTAEINKNTDVTVTWSDTLQATFNVIRDSLESKVAAGFRAMGVDVGKVWDFVARATKAAMNFVLSAAMAVPELIAATYDKIGPAFGDAFYRAANMALEALDWLVQKSAVPLNALTQAINNAFGTSIPQVVLPSIGRLENKFSGAMGRLGVAAAQSLVGGFKRDRIGDWSGAVMEEAERIARSRENEEAGGKVGKGAGKAAGSAAAKEMAKTWQEEAEARLAAMKLTIPKVLSDLIYADPIDLGDVGAKIAKEYEERERLQKELDQANRRRALDTAYDIADIIGGGVGDAIGQLANALDRAFPEFMAKIGGGLGGKLGSILGGLSSGAQIGGGVGGIMDGLGIKTSQTGAQIGGAIGQFAGPIGAIAGSIIGGVIGGLFKKTPKASATVSIIAGDVMDTVIKGNKGRLKEIAGGMAEGLISGLADIAEQFGAELGNASVSVGMRKKSYVVDPTGQGRTKGAGVMNFGEDEAAAIEYAMRDAISDGVFVGLSAGIERLLKGEGGLDKQLQKALTLQSVMTDAKFLGDPSGASMAELDKWKSALLKIATEAGEGMAEIEAVYAKRREDIVREAAEAAYQAMRPRRELEIRIMELEGKSVEALAASRALELEGMDAALRPLQERLWLLEDEADLLATASAAYQNFLSEQDALNARIWTAMGRTDLLRQRELDALDPMNRATLEWVYRLEDAKVASEAAARAEEARANERAGLETQLLQLQGDVAGLRARELAALDPLNRALQENIYALQDQAAAASAAAQQAAAIASERYNLETRLYQALGDTAALRARELAALDPSNRALQERINAVEDAKAAEAAAMQARDSLISSYQSEASALESTAAKFRDFGASIRQFRDGLFAQTATPQNSYAAALNTFRNTTKMAGLGNEASLAGFTRDAQAFLDAARNNAGSFTEYQQAVAMVAQASNTAIKGADSMASYAEQQIGYLQSQVAELANVNAATQSVEDAVAALAELEKADLFPSLEATLESRIDALKVEIERGRVESREAAQMAQAALEQAVIALNNISRKTTNWDRGDYVAVANDSDTPITATVSGTVSALITNTGAAQAVPVDTAP